jgi:glycosyltransferase involved in cell wall biosynthesis
MRIAQVVTFVSKDGAFGGPVAVAVAQCQALAEKGHDVKLLAAWDGEAKLTIPGVRVQLFKVRRRSRLALLFSPRLAVHLARSRRDYDAIHIHFGRDLVSLSAWIAARRTARKVVLQPHGMIQPDHRTSARVLDCLVVRQALRRSMAVLALTTAESAGLAEVAAAPLNPIPIRNGIIVPEQVEVRRPEDGPVLFLARLHPRKNVLVFAEAARRLKERGSTLRFRVMGPDEGDLPKLRRFIEDHRLEGTLTYGGVVGPGGSAKELAAASLFVLPSRGEVYPMTVLEALAQGTPVVLSDDSGLSSPLRAASAAVVTTPDGAAVADAIAGATHDETTRQQLGLRGHAYAREAYGIDSVADQLIELYGAA